MKACKYANSHELDLYLMNSNDATPTQTKPSSDPLFTSRIRNSNGKNLSYSSIDAAHHDHSGTNLNLNLNNKIDHLMVRLENESRLRSQKYRQMQQCLNIEMEIDEHTDYLNSIKSREADLTESYLLDDGDVVSATVPVPQPQNQTQNISNISNIHAWDHSVDSHSAGSTPAAKFVRSKKKVLFFNDRAFVRDQSSTSGSSSGGSGLGKNVSLGEANVSSGGCTGGGHGAVSLSSSSGTNTRLPSSMRGHSPLTPQHHKESIVDSTYLLGSDSETETETGSFAGLSSRWTSEPESDGRGPSSAANPFSGRGLDTGDMSRGGRVDRGRASPLHTASRTLPHPPAPPPPPIPQQGSDPTLLDSQSFLDPIEGVLGRASLGGIAMGSTTPEDETVSSVRVSIEADTNELQRQLSAAASRQQETSGRLKALLESLHRGDK